METKRQKQVGELIKRQFSTVLQQEGVYIYGTETMVTVTNVQMSPDLSHAKIYVSVFNRDNKQAVVLELQDQYNRLRQSLGSRIRKQVRRIPHLGFYLDDTLDEMERLNKLFDRLHENDQMGDESE